MWVDRARSLDAEDPLQEFRSRFVNEDPELIYLDGNSLGRMPLRASERLQALEREWGERLIRSWNESWINLPMRIGAKIARVIGASEDEVIVADSTTVNLYKLAQAALRYKPGGILSDDLNFPSDIYALSGLGSSLHVRRTDGVNPPSIDIPEDVTLVSLSAVAFKSGALYDVRSITAEAHAAGALSLWDLSHAAGAVELKLDEWGVDLAVGCTYKYLNGGPGSPAFLYVRRDLQEQINQPIQGWFGRAQAFDFGLDYVPADGIARFSSGTPPVASLALVEAGVDLILAAGIDQLVRKSQHMTAFLVEMYDAVLAPLGFRLNTPRDSARRASHVSFGHPSGWPICQALIEQQQVIPDFRAPDTIRFGCVPIYGTFTEIAEGVLRMARVVEARSYASYSGALAGEVT